MKKIKTFAKVALKNNGVKFKYFHAECGNFLAIFNWKVIRNWKFSEKTVNIEDAVWECEE